MRITEGQLRRIIREELLREAVPSTQQSQETWTDTRYTLRIDHPRTFGDTTIPDYETSELRASIRDGAMEIVNIYVPEGQRGQGIATQLIKRAISAGKERGLTVRGSGLYSGPGKALLGSLERQGLAHPDPGTQKHRLG